HIDGRFKGTITSREGRVIVGEKAVVEAQIQVDQIVIAGTVRGHVKATQSLDIKKTGEVVGDIEAPVVTIDSGAVLQGSCDTKRGDATDRTVSLAAKKNAKVGTAGPER
ncbi:polymer-forming cytoskeletal protein, partial [Thermodesulfobacteriota bacterium]